MTIKTVEDVVWDWLGTRDPNVVEGFFGRLQSAVHASGNGAVVSLQFGDLVPIPITGCQPEGPSEIIHGLQGETVKDKPAYGC